MPPTERWPSSVTRPACFASARNVLSSSGLRQRERHVHPRARVLRDRIADRTTSRRSPRTASPPCARLRSPMPCRPPWRFSHWNTRPAMYQAKVGGVLSIEPSFAIAAKSMNAGVAGARAAEQVVAHDHEREAGRADVLLRAARRSRRTSTRRSAATGSSRTCRRPAARRRRPARSETRRRRSSRSACSAGTPRRACSFQLATRRNRRVRLAGVGGDIDLARSASLRRSPSSTTRPCSRSRRRCPASSGSAARRRTARWRRLAGTAPCSSSAPPAARAGRPRPARRSR